MASQQPGGTLIIVLLIAALVLFIFAVTSGTTSGWGSAGVLTPLIISVFLVAGFFYFETRIPADMAAIPPQTWFLPNFLVLFFAALLPIFWWSTIFIVDVTLWQDVWHWSIISIAVHMQVSTRSPCLAALELMLARIGSPLGCCP